MGINIEALAAEFDKTYDEKALQGLDELHSEFLTKFPRFVLPDLELDQYALGRTPQGSLCWWLEFHTIPLGSIKGGTAVKHLIYYSKEHGWRYPKEFNSEQEAWEKLRGDMAQLLDHVEAGSTSTISDDNLLHRAHMLRGKLLYMYFRESFLPVYLLESIDRFLDELEVPKSERKGKDRTQLNQLLLQTVRSYELMKDWHPVKIKDFLYTTFLKEKYVKISPGQDAVYWQECLDGGYISIGWNEMGDLTQYADYDEFKKAFHKIGFQGTKNKDTEKANELWEFFSLQPGDKVIPNKGKSHILAIGTVTDKGYEFKNELATQKHTVYVKWDKKFDPPLEIAPQDYWPMKTVLQLQKKQVLDWTANDEGQAHGTGGKTSPKTVYSPEDELFFSRLEQALERKGQCILYGPPGTGKTYAAKRYIQWKSEKENLLNPTVRKTNYWLMLASAEQPFKWESILAKGGTVDWSLKSVKRNFYVSQQGDKILCYRGGSGKDNALVGVAEVLKPYDGVSMTVKGIQAFERPIPYEEYKEIAEYQATQAGRMNNRGTMFEVTEEFVQWVRDRLLELGDERAAEWLDVPEGSNVEICTFHPSFNYEDFIEGYKPVEGSGGTVQFRLQEGIFFQLCVKAQEHPETPYFLIIDELNRGNVPKIFGEIITLLEKDKRGMEVKLPQSRKRFSIPGNLFIIATMNTSDRSIQLMDAAIKRRFAFMECMPRYDLLEKEMDGTEMTPARVLEKLNRSLIRLQGRDKQIGQAYFMKDGEQIVSLEEMKEIYELEIIPLIQEYCFDDYTLLAEIIGEGFVDVENMEIRTSLFRETSEAFRSELEKHVKG